MQLQLPIDARKHVCFSTAALPAALLKEGVSPYIHGSGGLSAKAAESALVAMPRTHIAPDMRRVFVRVCEGPGCGS